MPDTCGAKPVNWLHTSGRLCPNHMYSSLLHAFLGSVRSCGQVCVPAVLRGYDQSCCWGLGAWWGWASEEPFHPRAAEIGPVGGEGKREHVAGQSSQLPSVASAAPPSLLHLAASSAG